MKYIIYFLFFIFFSCEPFENKIAINDGNIENLGISFLKNELLLDTISKEIILIKEFSNKRYKLYYYFLNPYNSFTFSEKKPIVLLYDTQNHKFIYENIFKWKKIKTNNPQKRGLKMNIYGDVEYRVLKYLLNRETFNDEYKKQEYIKNYLLLIHCHDFDLKFIYKSISIDNALDILEFSDINHNKDDIYNWLKSISEHQKTKNYVLCLSSENSLFFFDFVEFVESKPCSTIRTYYYKL